MNITFSGDFNNLFTKIYLEKYIYDMFISTVDPRKLIKFDNKFNINSLTILKKYIKDVEISKSSDYTYTIRFGKNLNKEEKRTVNLITYGNLDIKGYPIISELLIEIRDNIDYIYKG